MKTKLLLAFILLFALILNSQTFINDDFENDALGTLPNGWVIRYNGTGDANQKITDSPVKNGIHSFQVSGAGWAANLSKSVTTMPSEVTLEGWMRTENVGGRNGMAIGNPSAATWGAFIARVEFYNGNLITYYHTGYSGGYGTQYVLQSAMVNTWYHVKIEANTTIGTYKVFINGVQASSGATSEFPLLTTASPTSVELYGNSMIYFDDIKLYNTSGLVAYYPFNGNANDESGNNLHGTVSGATLTLDRFGNPASAYNFDGNDIITIPYNEKLNMDNELSISVWVMPTYQQDALILGKSNWWTQTNYLLRTKSTGFLQFEYRDMAYNTNNSLNANQWNHIAVVSDALNNKKVYINNVLSTHTGGTSPFNMVQEVLTIGGAGANGYNAEYFNGAIDDLRIYNSALTPQQVSNLYTYNTLKLEKIEQVENSNFYVHNNILLFKNTQNLQEIKSVEVYNLLGQKAFKTSVITKQIELNSLQKGIYILKVATIEGQNFSLKFLIE